MPIKNSEAEKRELYERIANMLVMDVAQKDIARAVGLKDAASITQIKDDPLFQEIYGSLVSDKAEEHKNINDGLDAIEMVATTRVLAFLNTSSNPDYALRALAVVNKATRKGQSAANKPIAAEQGQVVTIHLQQNFINAIQNTGGIDARPIAVAENAPIKQEQVLPPSQVEQILNLPKVKNVDDATVVGLAKIVGAVNLESQKNVSEAVYVDL